MGLKDKPRANDAGEREKGVLRFRARVRIGWKSKRNARSWPVVVG